MSIALTLSIGTIEAVFPDENRSNRHSEVYLWTRLTFRSAGAAEQIRLYSSEGLPLQTLTCDAEGEAVSMLLEPSEYYVVSASGCTALSVDSFGAVTLLGGCGQTDGTAVYLPHGNVGTLTLRATVTAEDLRNGRMDFVLTDGSYRRREVRSCEHIGEELVLSFCALPFGTYSLEKGGISVCEVILSEEHPTAEVVLP